MMIAAKAAQEEEFDRLPAQQQSDQLAADEDLREQQRQTMLEAAAVAARQQDMKHKKLKQLAAEQNAALKAERERHARNDVLREEQNASDRRFLAARHVELVAQATQLVEEQARAALLGLAQQGSHDADENAKARIRQQS